MLALEIDDPPSILEPSRPTLGIPSIVIDVHERSHWMLFDVADPASIIRNVSTHDPEDYSGNSVRGSRPFLRRLALMPFSRSHFRQRRLPVVVSYLVFCSS